MERVSMEVLMFDSCNKCNKHHLKLPDNDICLFPGNIIVLGRFNVERWIVKYGWFKFGGNRKICGWYLVQEHNKDNIKPIEDVDLYDIYLVQS